MSRTDLDPVTLAKALRRMAGDDSIEWVMEPMQASVLLDVADLLDENAKLRKLCTALYRCRDKVSECATCEDVECPFMHDCRLHDRMRELVVDA